MPTGFALGCIALLVATALIAVAIARRPSATAIVYGLTLAASAGLVVAATQYTAASFSQPIRRVFGTVVMRAREEVEMPAPGSLRPASLKVSRSDVIWDVFYAPVAGAVDRVAGYLNRFQFLTIRRYLILVFAAPHGFLSVLTVWH